MKKLILVCVSLVFTWYKGTEGLSCEGCDERKTKCQPLPPTCFPSRWPCGCCDVCAGKIGDACHGFSVQCEPGLVCVNNQGEQKVVVHWHDFEFRGICQRPSTAHPAPNPVVDQPGLF